MTETQSIDLRCEGADVERLYRGLSRDPRYGQYVRIPARICKCLDHFKVAYERPAVAARLHSYYLFIGVADDALETYGPAAGLDILEQLRAPARRFDEETKRSPVKLVTEVLKRQIKREVYAEALAGLENLYGAVLREGRAAGVGEYIRERKTVGRLTAEVSHVLIKPFIQERREALRSFFEDVGEVGCLLDSVIDLRADRRAQVLGFKPTASDFLALAGQVLFGGLRVLSKRPRLTGLFWEAAGDDLRDMTRARRLRRAFE